ncbi:MAG: hypothetical protein ACMUJI_16210 [Erythrobacter sp.]|jgi:hypothetical protein|uniref:hypothetical protein n=1 Tax=Erythrobacter sp. TaxID=1042 RepID=UPI003A89BFBF
MDILPIIAGLELDENPLPLSHSQQLASGAQETYATRNINDARSLINDTQFRESSTFG